MYNLEFFKKEAKKFLKDWQTQIKTVESDGFISYHYDWKFYDVGDLFFYYELEDKDEQEIMLARAQHYIAKMIGFKKWDDLIHSSETRLELSELLLRRFKNSQDVQEWEDAMDFSGLTYNNPEQVLDYAKQFYDLGDRLEIINFPAEKITVLTGKLKTAELNNFSDKNNPSGLLRKKSYVFCPHCKKAFNYTLSKVIKDNDSSKTMVVCKNYPDCKGTYLDYKVLTPTILYGQARIDELKRGIEAFPNLSMNKKIECLHCGDKYLYNEAQVVVDPDNGEPWIHCKNYPNCNGSPLDFVPVE